jgi:hypothetical protein
VTASDRPQFSGDFDQAMSLGDSESVHFGRDVLRGLVDGIQEELHHQKTHGSRWHWGTGVLGCAMWMDDAAFMETLGACNSVCVVVTKQPQDRRSEQKYEPLRRFAETAEGLAQEAFPELAELAPLRGGAPLVVGPGTPSWHGGIPPVRELGFRKVNDRLVPIVHAKLALVGQMRWTDEHPSGHLVDEIYFAARRLWIGSANFTLSSRRSLEMGMWTTEPHVLAAARRFLLTLIAASEPLESGHVLMTPELTPVEYDDQAIIEYLRDAGIPDESDDDE